MADQVIAVEEMTRSHEFVKGLNTPLVTVYTEQQMCDIRRFCCIENGCVLGIDKTYNLGEFYVTPTVYKDLSVESKKTEDHPICFGPTLIHTKSTTITYSRFLHEIADQLSESEISKLTIGSDEELALKSAIKRCFVGVTHVLCCRHLRKNAKDYMENLAGYPLEDRQELLREIFSPTGILEDTDQDTFRAKVSTLTEKIALKDQLACGKPFQQYWETKLLPLLKEHVIQPIRQKKISGAWTNNNSESANHKLKASMDWKLSDLPKFVRDLFTIVKGEQIERARAIRGMGNFRLHELFCHHAVDVDRWVALTQEQRNNKEMKFLKEKVKTNPNLVFSSNGKRTAVKSKTAGRKPHQIRSGVAERSRTQKSKKRLLHLPRADAFMAGNLEPERKRPRD